MEHWVELLRSGKATGAHLGEVFVNSNEMKESNLNRTPAQYIERLYRTIFDREADLAGQAYWLEELQNPYAKNSVLAAFINSNEFWKVCREYEIMQGHLALDMMDAEPKKPAKKNQ